MYNKELVAILSAIGKADISLGTSFRGSDLEILSSIPEFSQLIIRLCRASAVISVTNQSALRLLRQFGNINDKTIVIHNGIDIELWDKRNKNYNTSIETIGHYSSMKWHTGIEILLKSFIRIKEKYNKVSFLLIGSPVEKRILDEVIKVATILKNDFKHIPHMKQEYLPEQLSNIDLLIFPSLSEGCPNKVIEAMAMGIPILASKVGAIPEIICNEVNGYLLNNVSEDSIINSFDYIYNHYNRMIECARRAKADCNMNHSIKSESYNWQQFYNYL